jgi:thiol-disulfide isomerase/thioredoxin
LLDEKVYDFDLVSNMQRLIEALQTKEPRKALILADRMLPNLFTYFKNMQSQPEFPPVLVAQQIGAAYEYGSIYRELDQPVRAAQYATGFLAGFKAESLGDNKIYQKALDAATLRLSVYNAAVPPLEVVEYIDTPKLSLVDLRGKVVMLDFFAHWCTECITDVPIINSLQKKYQDKGLVALGVTKYYGFFGDRQGISQSDELAALKNLKARLNLDYGLVVTSPSVEERYGVAALPTIVLIDRKGMVRFIETGYNGGRVEKVIAKLINDDRE